MSMFGGISNLLFNKIGMKIKFDDSIVSEVPSTHFKVVHAFDVEGAMTGTVRVSLPDTSRLYHYGIKVGWLVRFALFFEFIVTIDGAQIQVVQSIVFHEPSEVSIDLCHHAHELVPEGYLS
jgi:hypothetical protein